MSVGVGVGRAWVCASPQFSCTAVPTEYLLHTPGVHTVELYSTASRLPPAVVLPRYVRWRRLRRLLLAVRFLVRLSRLTAKAHALRDGPSPGKRRHSPPPEAATDWSNPLVARR